LQERDLIAVRSVEQYFDPVKSMFLPDRYSRRMPKVRHEGPVR
jgi:methionyl-tRNA synthetase